MKTFLVVVWLLSNGHLQGEPWIEFKNDRDSCEEKVKTLPPPSIAEGRLLFIAGCLDEGAAYTGFYMRLLNKKNER